MARSNKSYIFPQSKFFGQESSLTCVRKYTAEFCNTGMNRDKDKYTNIEISTIFKHVLILAYVTVLKF